MKLSRIILVIIFALGYIGCGKQNEPEIAVKVTQTEEEFKKLIIGAWQYTGPIAEGITTYHVDGTVEYVGTIKRQKIILKFTAKGKYTIKGNHIKNVIESSSKTISDLWPPGTIEEATIIKITANELIYDKDGPTTEYRVIEK